MKGMLIMNNIKASRKEQGLTQQELANELYISARQTIGNWEKGEDGGITLQQLRGLCSLFNCEIGYIVGDYDTKRKATADASEETGLSNASILSLSSPLEAKPYIPLLDFLLTYRGEEDEKEKEKDKEREIHFLRLLSEYFYSIDSDTREDAIRLLEIQNTMNKLKTEIKKRVTKHKKLF